MSTFTCPACKHVNEVDQPEDIDPVEVQPCERCGVWAYVASGGVYTVPEKTNQTFKTMSKDNEALENQEARPAVSNYVLGFMFGKRRSSIRTRVLLLHKQRPPQQLGMLNGIGGHIEEGELPHAAMVREFHEETGIRTTQKTWKHFLALSQPGEWHMQVFCAEVDLDVIHKAEDTFKSAEPLRCLDVAFVLGGAIGFQLVEHVPWLVARALEVLRQEGDSLPFLQVQHHIPIP